MIAMPKGEKNSGVKAPHSKVFPFQCDVGMVQKSESSAFTTGRTVVESLRIQLIEQLCRLPDTDLARVDELLRSLAHAPPDRSFAETSSLAAQSVPPLRVDWPHAPTHRLSEHGTFLITAATVNKEHLFRGPECLTFLEDELLTLAKQYEVCLEAWAVFSNHYHFIAHVLGTENPLASLIARLHANTATELNKRHGTYGRQVWFQYWDTQLTFEKSYFARLNYVHHNAVKHGLVQRANEYRWCSASWFERTAPAAQVKTIYGFKYDRIQIHDDYEPVL